jgi:diacylglycerol kinase (ATP)
MLRKGAGSIVRTDAAPRITSITSGLGTAAEVIFNPAGRGGAAQALLPEVVQRFEELGVSVRETRAPGDEERFAGEAIGRGVTTIVAVGGDGTCSNVANAILRERSECRLAVIPAGTGNDFAKTLGIRKHSVREIVKLISGGSATSIDVGVADGRYFINSCGFGFDASVLEATRRVRFLKGDALYIYAALAQLFTYRGFPVDVGSEDTPSARELLMATVSNGRFLGGAFRIAPEASVTDGELDFCLIGNASVQQRIRLFAAAIRGTHKRFAAVEMFRSQSLSLTFAAPPWIELDGELRQASSREMRISCVPRALRVIAAPGAAL